jgi:uncharacterized membrane protein
MVGLGDLPGGLFSSVATDLTGDGSAVVGMGRTGSAAVFEAFYWTEDLGMVNLQEWLMGNGVTNLTGWSLTSAQGISEDGKTIVGYGVNPLGQTEAWLATVAVPEASTIWLLGLSVVGLALVRRKFAVSSSGSCKTTCQRGCGSVRCRSFPD